MHSPGRKGQEGDDRVCEGGAGMCGALSWSRGSMKDLGVRISRQASRVGLAVPDSLQRDEAGETSSKEQEGASCDSSQGMFPTPDSASGTMQRSRRFLGHMDNNPWNTGS